MEESPVTKNRPAVVIGLGLLLRLVFLQTVPAQSVSADVRSWLQVASVLEQGGNPYQVTSYLNWPPFWMVVIFVLNLIGRILHISLTHMIQLFLMAVESCLILVLFRIFRQIGQQTSAQRLLLFGIALNPICIFQVCQHCNFDVLVAMWVAACLSMLISFRDNGQPASWLMACLFLGCGAVTKTVPLVLFPLCLLGARRLNRNIRIIGAYLAITPLLLSMAVLFVLTPAAVWEHVLAYRSFPGYFGVTGLVLHFLGSKATTVYTPFFVLSLAVFLTYVAYQMLTSEQAGKSILLMSAAALFMIVVALGPGYGPQYIYWTLPLLLLCYSSADPSFRLALRVGYLIAALTYLVEYALLPSLGMFLVGTVQAPSLLSLGEFLSSQWHQSLLRLPLFTTYCVLLAMTLRRLHWFRRP